MAAIVPDYEYDIFISYRHNDNLDGWVGDFVAALQKELKATLKNEVSIYFDKNPHDGLHDTHVVDESLKKKLKCLIFIPILSQTYCDEKSFAWQHEFLAFNEMAKADELGMNISLANGNVASRILPVQIHDIDTDDQQNFESVTGAALRAIDFIYKEAGVNRSLKPEDDKKENLNNTSYSNQLNKVANALKDLGAGIVRKNQGQEPEPKKASSSVQSSVSKPSKKGLFITLAIVALLIIGYLGYKNYSSPPLKAIELAPEDKSIAVLPFTKISSGEEVDAFAFGLHDDLLTQLSKLGELRVTSRTSVMGYENTKKNIREIAKELDVSYILEGSIQQANNRIRLNVQLIGGESDEHIWAEVFDSEITLDNIFQMQSEISTNIAHQLHMNLTTEIRDELSNRVTDNLDALKYYHRGMWLFDNALDNLARSVEAIDNFQSAVDLDSNFHLARMWLIRSLSFTSKQSSIHSAENKNRAKTALDYLEMNAPDTKNFLLAKVYYEYYAIGNFAGAEAILLGTDLNDSEWLIAVAYVSRRLGKWDVYFKNLEETLVDDPRNSGTLSDLGLSYNYFRNYTKEREYHDRGIALDVSNEKIAKFSMLSFGMGQLDKAITYHQSIKSTLTLEENTLINYWSNYLKRDFEAAASFSKNIPPFLYFSSDNYNLLILVPSKLFEAQTFWFLGEFEKAKLLVDKIKDQSANLHAIVDCPVKPGKDFFGQDAALHIRKGYFLFFKGMVNEARDQAIHAQGLYTSKQDALQGAGISFMSLRLLAFTKDIDNTIPLIDHLLNIPSRLSTGMLKVDPLYDYLRDNPDFIKLLEKYSGK
jgi:TolB-like protein/tetratricopeptide (TPR) repeat protein